MSLTLTLPLDVPVRPMDAKGLEGYANLLCIVPLNIFIAEVIFTQFLQLTILSTDLGWSGGTPHPMQGKTGWGLSLQNQGG